MRMSLTLLALGLTTGVALAQAPANPDPKTPAVATQDTAQPARPARGANSFTEAQAQERIAEAGFSGVSGLVKDNDGVWRGKAMRNGVQHDVALDYQGNVFPRQ
ncbi:PepSY domain-containing protein [Camelimonas abortus]|uniref:PepSY domain-containing protein n=1 Tax=Camelimonas abortus TaxID=1017184 RepID=A0ABV7LFB1_9HYPH